jgi:ApaG protein
MYSRVTNDIKVTVLPTYLENHSEPDENRYIWAYTIQLENHGSKPVQLLNRYWHITDSIGRSQEVRGPGVIGEQPVLKPGDIFQYTSGTSLQTPSGIMVGSYEMVDSKGEHFDIVVPAFSLDSPYHSSKPN